MTAPTLLPCACGKGTPHMVNSTLPVEGTPYSMLECRACGYRTKKWHHQSSAIDEWNEWQAVRPAPQPTPEQAPTWTTADKLSVLLDWMLWRLGF